MAAIKIGVAAWHDIATYYPPGHRSSSERFDYYYSQEEMEDWAPRIAMMKRNAVNYPGVRTRLPVGVASWPSMAWEATPSTYQIASHSSWHAPWLHLIPHGTPGR